MTLSPCRITDTTLTTLPFLLYRFRMKVLLFILLRTFAFSPALPYSAQIVHRQSIVNKPVKRGSEKDGATMPLSVTRAP